MQIGLLIQWFGGVDIDFFRVGFHKCESCDSFVIILLGVGIIFDFGNKKND